MTDTGARVPYYPSILQVDGIRPGKPVRAEQWASAADLANHLLGRGRVLIPDSAIDYAVTNQTAKALRFYVQPAYQATHRVWQYVLTTTGSTGACIITFADPSGGSVVHRIGGAGDYHFLHVETVSSRTATETEVVPTFTRDVASTKGCTITSIKCWELPRTSLALDANDYGADASTIVPTSPIYDTANVSISGVSDAYAQTWATACRAGLFQWALPTPGYETSSGSYVAVFAAPVPILTRKRLRSSTTGSIKVWVRTSSDASTSGSCRVTMTSGYTHTFTISSGSSPTWQSDSGTADCEDNTVSDGRRSTRDDKCTIEMIRSAGAGKVYLESVSIING